MTMTKDEAMKHVLRRILEDLPVKRDWLDPGLEKAARSLVKESTERDELVRCCGGAGERRGREEGGKAETAVSVPVTTVSSS